MTTLLLRKKLNEKRAEAKKILSTVAASPEARDMSPEESARFDKLMADVETLKTQVGQSEAMEADEAESASATPAPAPEAARSGRRSAPIAEAPAVHAGEPRPYSYLRALRLASDGHRLDGLEGEVSAEIERRTGIKAKGFYLPTGSDPELRSLMTGRRRPELRADLTLATGAGGIFNVPELPLIELLRARLVIAKLGCTMLNNMHGIFSIPRQTSTASVYWLAENASATPTAPALDQVGFAPKVAIAATNISRLFMDQTSLDAEAYVKNDLAQAMARDLDRVAIKGGGSNEPVGILATAGVISQSAALQGGANGLAPTWNQVVGLETLVAQANADEGPNLGYLTNPLVRGYLKRNIQFPASAGSTAIWQDGPEPGVGELNGYKALTTTNVPSNLVKGTSGAVASALIFGYWPSLVLATWEGIDTIVNPYTYQLSGAVVISMSMSVDIRLKHDQSFAAIYDALTV